LLYAASLQATETGGQRAASAIANLESDQDDDGSGHSRRYRGPPHGTYRAVLSLTSGASDSRALGRAATTWGPGTTQTEDRAPTAAAPHRRRRSLWPPSLNPAPVS